MMVVLLTKFVTLKKRPKITPTNDTIERHNENHPPVCRQVAVQSDMTPVWTFSKRGTEKNSNVTTK